MFCPFCGSPFTRVGAALVCRAGEMSLSRAMEEALATAEPGPRPAPDRGASHWHCAHCGVQMTAGTGPACGACGRSYTEALVYQLVELHPHRSGERS